MSMKVLIKYYDKDVLKNIMAPLSLKPDKIIFLYDEGLQDFKCFYGLNKCFKRHIPHIVLEKYSVNILDLQSIYEKTSQLITDEDTVSLDLTGGSELMLLAGFKAGSEKKADLYYTDIIGGAILDLNTQERVHKIVRLSLEDFIEAKGARFMGNSHQEPDPKRYQDILEMSQILFENLPLWQQTSNFMQIVAARHSPHDIHMESRLEVSQKNGHKVGLNKKLLYAFQKHGFIKNVKMTQNNVSFSFCSVLDKQYVINYGVWLELYVFITAKLSGAFDDVKLGAMIDWDAYDGQVIAGNEIDVLLSDNSLPVFISCKLRNADSAAINELVVAKKRVGGWFSKGIIVAYGRDKQDKSGTYRRAKELGIEMLDAKDIVSPNFGERLVRTVKEHDLVSLKWKKV